MHRMVWILKADTRILYVGESHRGIPLWWKHTHRYVFERRITINFVSLIIDLTIDWISSTIMTPGQVVDSTYLIYNEQKKVSWLVPIILKHGRSTVKSGENFIVVYKYGRKLIWAQRVLCLIYLRWTLSHDAISYHKWPACYVERFLFCIHHKLHIPQPTNNTIELAEIPQKYCSSGRHDE